MKPLTALLVFATVAVASCASYDGRGLTPGVPAQEVRQLMGAPAATYANAQGGERWAYPRGPAGLQTYMVRIDAGGRFAGIDQVLDQAFFAQLHIGQDRQPDVDRLFGPHWRTTDFPRQKEQVWSWRFRDVWGNRSQFHVTFDETGLVKRWQQIEEERGESRWEIN